MISSTYPGPPSMPRSVTLAKHKNKGKSYITFLKPIVSAEWLRQIRLKYPHAPLPPSGNVSSRLYAYFLLHHLPLCNNLYKLPPYPTMCHQEITRVILCRLILNDIIIHMNFFNDIIMFYKIV